MDIYTCMLNELNRYQFIHKDFNTFFNNINVLLRAKKRTIKNILISQAGGIGDSILSTPFIREIHNIYPSANIYLVIPKEHIPIYKNCNYINILPFNPNVTNMFTILKDVIDFCINKLLHKEIDIAFSPMWDPKVTILFLNWLSGALVRVGYGKHTKAMYFSDKNYYYNTFGNEFNFDEYLLTDQIHNPFSMYHEIDRRLYIIESFCKKKITNKTLTLFNEKPTETKNQIVVGIGGSNKNKKYPLEKWISILNEFKNDYEIILLGDKNDEININDNKITNLIGKLSLDEVISVINSSKLYVGHDTSLMHIASACNIPIVVLYKEAIDREKYLPGFLSYYCRYRPLNKSICIRPNKAIGECREMYVEGHCCANETHCIKNIVPGKVINAMKKLLH